MRSWSQHHRRASGGLSNRLAPAKFKLERRVRLVWLTPPRLNRVRPLYQDTRLDIPLLVEPNTCRPRTQLPVIANCGLGDICLGSRRQVDPLRRNQGFSAPRPFHEEQESELGHVTRSEM